MKGDPDDLTPLDARESLLMEDHHPQRKDYSEMSRFNFARPYEPFRDRAIRQKRGASTERLVGGAWDPSLSDLHARSLSQESRGRNSVEGHHAAAPGYGYAF